MGSICPTVSPAFFNAIVAATDADFQAERGSAPLKANALSVPNGSRLSSLAFFFDIRTQTAAPSFSPDELPAVHTTPITGFSLESPSRVVSLRGRYYSLNNAL